MAVVLSMTTPSGRAAYEAVTALLDLDADPPRGLIVHTACETEAGVQIVDVWESAADIDAFFGTRLGKAIAEVGMEAPAPTLTETFNTYLR